MDARKLHRGNAILSDLGDAKSELSYWNKIKKAGYSVQPEYDSCYHGTYATDFYRLMPHGARVVAVAVSISILEAKIVCLNTEFEELSCN